MVCFDLLDPKFLMRAGRLKKGAWAPLDFCELAAVNRAMEERGGAINEESEDVRLGGEEVEDFEDGAVEDDFKRRAITLAATFGDSSVHRYEWQSLQICQQQTLVNDNISR